MRKLLIILATLTAFTTFALDVDVRLQARVGAGIYPGIHAGADLIVRSNIYTSSDLDVYLGTGLDVKGTYMIMEEGNKNIFNLAPMIVLGLQEGDNIKYYQQIGLGIGYIHNKKSNAIFIPEIEVGLNYKDFVFSIELQPTVPYSDEKIEAITHLSLGIGYEF